MVTVRSDFDVRRDVVEALAFDPRVDVSAVEVEVVGGIVYLRGNAGNGYERRLFEDIADSVEGVVDVVNDLRLALAPSRPDQDVASDVRAALAKDPRVDASGIQVDVSGGVVRLSGQVHSYVQRLHAEEDAWSVPGVVDVENAITLRPALRLSDREIADEIRARLAIDRRVPDERLHVDVRDGVVRLSGSVWTPQQKRLALDIAWSTIGVRNVIDEVKVVPYPPTD